MDFCSFATFISSMPIYSVGLKLVFDGLLVFAKVCWRFENVPQLKFKAFKEPK